MEAWTVEFNPSWDRWIVRGVQGRVIAMCELETDAQTIIRFSQLPDIAEMLWVVIANVSGGDWTKQTPEWQEAAAKYRDLFFKVVEKPDEQPDTPPDPVG